MEPGAECARVKPADPDGAAPGPREVAGYDAVFLTGSPLHLHEDTPETRRVVEFMRAVFAAGAPAFGSCAGLQVAVVAAGGTVKPNHRHEAGFGRRIAPTEAGRDHPLLAGRPPAYDAITLHRDETERLPEGALLLASNSITKVQAAEIRVGEGVFWGVQYHPELSLEETAASLRRQASSLVEQGLAMTPDAVEDYAALMEALGKAPDRTDLAWRPGLDEQVIDQDRRRLEMRNFIDRLVKPTRSARGRA